MKRYDVINHFIKTRNYKSFLLIGVYQGVTTNLVKCLKKVSVDPNPLCDVTHKLTSDEFFKLNDLKFDIIFIDGLHLHLQVVSDIKNSFKVLNKGGVVLCHDCLPELLIHQLREFTGSEWTGDVWKAILCIYNDYQNISIQVVDTDWGIGILEHRDQQRVQIPYLSLKDLNFDFFMNNKEKFMNIITVLDFKKRYV